MNNIPTADVVLEYLIPNAKNEMTGLQYTNALEAIRSHGKHYVEAALKAAAQKAQIHRKPTGEGDLGYEDYIPVEYSIYKESILNAYHLTNII